MPAHTTKCLLFAILIGAAFASARARAFSDPIMYAEPVDLGGGAGRWFTGSSADGYGCDVCHVGSAGADLVVTGIPTSGYIAGQAHEVSLTWPSDVLNVALIAEFTDEERHGAGAIVLPRPETLKPAELCAEDQGGQSPVQLHDFEGNRKLVSVVDCGARVVRFLWTAPPSAAGTIWFNAGFVRSNADAAPTGDGVTLVRSPITVAGSAPVRTIAEGCSAVGSNRSTPAFTLLGALLAVLRVRRRTRTGMP